jgi:uncharacterized membrane protein
MKESVRKAEVDLWVAKGIITPAQAGKILDLYVHEQRPLYRRMSFWLQCLAALLTGFALFLVISENWQRLHWTLQSLIAVVPLVAAQALAVVLEKRDKPTAAEAAWFFASIALGANIMLQAQIFHISSYYPNGILFWVIGMLPVIILRASTVNYLLATVLFTTYLMMQLEHHQFSPISLLPLAVFALFTWSKQRTLTVLPLFTVLYFFLLVIQQKWQIRAFGPEWELSLILFGSAVLAQLSRLREEKLRRILLLLFIFTALINMVLTFSFASRRLYRELDSPVVYGVAVVSLIILFMNRRSLRQLPLFGLIAANVFLTMACVLVQRFLTGSVEDPAEPVGFMRIAANLLYLGSVAFLLFRAIADRSKLLFMGSTAALLLWALVRYIDLFRNYLVTALIFILSAVALVLLNRLWEKKYED